MEGLDAILLGPERLLLAGTFQHEPDPLIRGVKACFSCRPSWSTFDQVQGSPGQAEAAALPAGNIDSRAMASSSVSGGEMARRAFSKASRATASASCSSGRRPKATSATTEGRDVMLMGSNVRHERQPRQAKPAVDVRSMEVLDDTPAAAPIAWPLGERRDGKDDDFIAAHKVDHRERKLPWVNPASAVLVRRTDVGKCASNLDSGLHLTGEPLSQPFGVLLVVRCLGVKLELSFRVEASRPHLRLCRTREKTCSAGERATVPASTSAIRL